MMTEAEKTAVLQFIGATFGERKKLDSSITNSTQFLTPGAENIKNIAERVLRTPSVQQQQYLDAQQATKLAMWESNPQNPLPDTIRVNQQLQLSPDGTHPQQTYNPFTYGEREIIARLDKILELLYESAKTNSTS